MSAIRYFDDMEYPRSKLEVQPYASGLMLSVWVDYPDGDFQSVVLDEATVDELVRFLEEVELVNA